MKRLTVFSFKYRNCIVYSALYIVKKNVLENYKIEESFWLSVAI